MRRSLEEVLAFTWKQARACVFAGSFFAILALSRWLPLGPIARYDFILLAALALQAALVLARVETLDELKVVGLFHLVGLVLEVFKTHPAVGSWSYPEPGVAKLLTVPLYSGFMYAAVGSYMCQAWRLFDVRLTGYPPYRHSLPLCAAIYLNFFSHHVLPDLRWVLAGLVLWAFRRTRVHFTALRVRRSLPLVLCFVLIGACIWGAENLSTYLGAWVYPHQTRAWRLVTLGKISSWSLLAIISFILVADLKHLKERLKSSRRAAATAWAGSTGADSGAGGGDSSPPSGGGHPRLQRWRRAAGAGAARPGVRTSSALGGSG